VSREINLEWVRPDSLDRTSEQHAAALVCADAAARGVFPTDELLVCLEMLGLDGVENP
jgi:hypothetical protein